MNKPWHPQRNEQDSAVALLKSLINYIQFPISRSTIEKDASNHKNYPHFGFEDLIELLGKWGLKAGVFSIEQNNLKDLPPSTIFFINEKQGTVKSGGFVMLHEVNGDEIEYLHPRKGWVVESTIKFFEKWEKFALTLIEPTSDGESDFEAKEKLYEEQKFANPDLKNIRLVDNFITDDECDYIINLSTPLFERSLFLYGDKRVLDERRTSYSAELHTFPDDPVLIRITKRASELLKIPQNHFEHFQCLSYDTNQEIDHHYDVFDENSEGGKKIIAEGGQRKITMFAYLNDGYEGGTTYFPDLDLMITPKKGRVLIFNNLDDNGNLLKKAAWHGGLPVTRGRKFGMNMWVHDKPCR